jgi:hypothetical protein
VRGDEKLITLDGAPDELFHLGDDPGELHDRLPELPQEAAEMDELIQRLIAATERQRAMLAEGATLDLEGDERLLQQLRALGYID